ncbi:hypothetical protein GCM10010182_43580 [Actinomadura cremea]|nr:hypothetical protein GCM10010182_43580 [Actinomadura cremea]
MDAASIQCEAHSLRGRHAHVARSVARLLAVAGFALAGWIALAALNDAAMADDGTSRSGAPRDLAGTPRDVVGRPFAPSGPSAPAGRSESGPAVRNEPGLATLRHFGLQRDWSPRATAEVVTGDVRDVRERPVDYLRERGRDVASDKDAAVSAVRGLGDAAGVPHMRVRDTDPDRPILGTLVGKVSDTAPLPLPQPAGDAPAAQQDGAASGETGPSEKPTHTEKAVFVGDGKAVPAQFAGAVDADDLPDPAGCATCRGGQGPLDAPPALPGQDNPRNGSASGGHPFTHFADLATAVDPAALPGMDLRAFRRTSLTDIAAPGRPAVVPD